MLPAHRVTTHPGEILLREFLEPLRLSQAGLARALHIPQNRVNELVRGKRGITPETAILLAEYFGTSAEFWMNLQSAHDLTKARMRIAPQSVPARRQPGKIRGRALSGAD
jgi:addiction module HigA family antidote